MQPDDIQWTKSKYGLPINSRKISSRLTFQPFHYLNNIWYLNQSFERPDIVNDCDNRNSQFFEDYMHFQFSTMTRARQLKHAVSLLTILYRLRNSHYTNNLVERICERLITWNNIIAYNNTKGCIIPDTAIIWTPIFEWYVVRCGSKKGHQEVMCLKEIGLRSIVKVIHSKINIIRGPVWPLNEHEIFTLTMNKIFLQGRYGIANHLTLIACFISYEKWVQREKYPNNTRLPQSINSKKKERQEMEVIHTSEEDELGVAPSCICFLSASSTPSTKECCDTISLWSWSLALTVGWTIPSPWLTVETSFVRELT